MVSLENIRRRGWLLQRDAGRAACKRLTAPRSAGIGQISDSKTCPGWMQASPHGARMCDIRGSLQGGERSRDRKQQTQVEPHPRPSRRRKPKHQFRQGTAPRNLLPRLPTFSLSPRRRLEGAIPYAHTFYINQACTTSTQITAPEPRRLLHGEERVLAARSGSAGGSQGEAVPTSEGRGSLTRITMQPVRGAGTSCPRPPKFFGCHQPEVNRFCSSNKLVTKATVLISKCN